LLAIRVLAVDNVPVCHPGSLLHTPGLIALVALARERGLDTVYMPAIDAREAMLLRLRG
jgi:hypothetical protein